MIVQLVTPFIVIGYSSNSLAFSAPANVVARTAANLSFVNITCIRLNAKNLRIAQRFSALLFSPIVVPGERNRYYICCIPGGGGGIGFACAKTKDCLPDSPGFRGIASWFNSGFAAGGDQSGVYFPLLFAATFVSRRNLYS
ncbi:MAG: hypothetical protein JWM99_4111, partial [Verrucomicrobiales bacterium]|nr:hypothetical protein [Verrucomicrobiales bacterium]